MNVRASLLDGGLVDSARALTLGMPADAAAQADRDATFPADAYHAVADAGIVGMALPSRYGGRDLSIVVQARVVETLAQGCAAVVGAVIGNGIQAGLTLLHGCSEVARASVLPALISGERQVAFAITEAGAGSDAAAMNCSATRVDGGWRIDGEKVMINRASLSSSAIVFATADRAQRHRGVAAFLIGMNQPGVQVGPALRKMGQRGLPTESIRFVGATVPAQDQLSEVGEGFALMMKVVNHARTMVAANAVGRMSASLAFVLGHVHRREQFGKPLAAMDAVRAQVADMAVLVETARSMMLRAAQELDDGGDDVVRLAAMAKLHATDACIEVCRQAMLLCGGMGYMDEYPVERMLRDALAGQVVDGANPVQRHTIATETFKRWRREACTDSPT